MKPEYSHPTVLMPSGRKVFVISRSMNFIRQCLSLAGKDIRLEMRTRHSVASTTAFSASAILLLGLSIDASLWNPSTRSGLFWIMFTFSLILGIGRLFAGETERHTDMLLRSMLPPDAVYLGKFLSHLAFGAPVLLICNLLFVLFFGHYPLHWGAFLLLNVLSLLSFSALFTFLGALAAVAGVKGSIFSVLSVPLLVPLVLVLVRCGRYAYSVGWIAGAGGDFISLAAYFGAIFTTGLLLFESAWES